MSSPVRSSRAHDLVVAVDVAARFVELGMFFTDVELHVRDTLGAELTTQILFRGADQELGA